MAALVQKIYTATHHWKVRRCYAWLYMVRLQHIQPRYCYGNIPEFVRLKEIDLMALDTNGKSALGSMAVQGGILTIVPVIDRVLDATGILPGGFAGEIVALSAGFVGSMMAIWGRIRARFKISKLF